MLLKRYKKELIILTIQLLMFYVYPVFAMFPMGMVLMILTVTLLLSAVLGCISGNRIKFLYPVAVALLFIPSVWIYYNESALVHALWYLVVSAVGLLLGIAVRRIFKIC